VTSDNIKATELGDLSGFLGMWPGLAKEDREQNIKKRKRDADVKENKNEKK
jgi:hypothetical protein